MSVRKLFSKEKPTQKDLLIMTSHLDLTDRAKDIGFDLVCKNLTKLQTIKDEEIKIPTPSKYNCFNPSIAKTVNGYICVIRTSNYKYDDSNALIRLDKEINTINYVVEMNHDFKIISCRMLDNPHYIVNPPCCERLIFGCEDFRIRSNYGILEGDELVGTYTCHNQFKGIFSNIGETRYNLKTNEIIESRIHASPNGRYCEKNWLPFEDKFIYQFHPLTLLDKFGRIILTRSHNLDLSRFRGSCSPIRYKDELLCLIHETSKTEFRYVHRFVRMSNDFRITHISTPFTFQGDNIEYCCGMCPSDVEGIVILTYGVRDVKARICSVNLDNIEWLTID